MRSQNPMKGKLSKACCDISVWIARLRRQVRAGELDAILSNIERFVPDNLLERLWERSSDPAASKNSVGDPCPIAGRD